MKLAIMLQVALVVWLLSSLRFRKDDCHFLDKNSISAFKGYFSIIIVLFHVPVSSVLYNLLGCIFAVVIVTLFSFFSTYGMTLREKADPSYINTIPMRFIMIAVPYIIVRVIKYCITGQSFSGGIWWINSLLLSYVVFYLVHKFIRGGRRGDCLIIIFWILYGIVMKVCPNNYFGWPAQSFGFAYGVIVAAWSDRLQRFFVSKIRLVTIISSIFLPVLGIIYLQIHTPAQENMKMYGIRIVMSFIMILLFLAVSVRVSIVSKIMSYLGNINLYIFLLHGLVIDILMNYLADGWLILACIVCSVGGAACFKLLEERLVIGRG